MKLGKGKLIENKDRRTKVIGRENKNYLLVYIENPSGTVLPLLLTTAEVTSAYDRGRRNPEDVEPLKPRWCPW